MFINYKELQLDTKTLYVFFLLSWASVSTVTYFYLLYHPIFNELVVKCSVSYQIFLFFPKWEKFYRISIMNTLSYISNQKTTMAAWIILGLVYSLFICIFSNTNIKICSTLHTNCMIIFYYVTLTSDDKATNFVEICLNFSQSQNL